MAPMDESITRQLAMEIGELQRQIESLARIVSALVQRIPEPEQSEILRLVSDWPKVSEKKT
ncbi:hypothetical protein [Mesoterricola sediminis]|uniref:Uncharacterized protein n=1 Tax=Mesoterricola sediminis TaxID=2927980 RepID=A0AA48GXA7_9BACT|nr:hypothetical protein [Mesoterricola sediminis]BDU77984.1 hypothetical protein METESE_29420 [Mesoterricola sediminis]